MDPRPNETPLSADVFAENFHAIMGEMRQVVLGQEAAIEHLLTAVFAGGHVLLSGLPGLGRTLMVKTLGTVLGLAHRRMQFTPDLLPTDIVGAEVLEQLAGGERHFRFFKGPVFANLVLADEINRSPARTQSALLEVMQEKQVTSGGRTYRLPKPFVLVATQNTVDNEGVFPLGEAQADRFMMSIEQDYPPLEAEQQILLATTGLRSFEPRCVANPEMVLAMQALAREVPVVPSVKRYALSIVRASRPGQPGAAEEAELGVRLGGSPRAAQALLMGAKVTALSRGRRHVSKDDVDAVVMPVMSHRLLMDVRAQAEGRTPAQVVDGLLRTARTRTEPKVSHWTQELLKAL